VEWGFSVVVVIKNNVLIFLFFLVVKDGDLSLMVDGLKVENILKTLIPISQTLTSFHSLCICVLCCEEGIRKKD
jgi:hypothetical protein